MDWLLARLIVNFFPLRSASAVDRPSIDRDDRLAERAAAASERDRPGDAAAAADKTAHHRPATTWRFAETLF